MSEMQRNNPIEVEGLSDARAWVGSDASKKLLSAAQSEVDRLAHVKSAISKYGLEAKASGDQYEIYFRAGGKDNVVLNISKNFTSLEPAEASLGKLLVDNISHLESAYNVKFAAAGEPVTRQVFRAEDCLLKSGKVVNAKQPTFADLFAIEHALKHSEPSQLSADGKDGVKISILEDRVFTEPGYGNQYTKASWRRADKDKHIALELYPDGEKLPPTAKDVLPGARYFSWFIAHELAHNSQNNIWTSPYDVPSNVLDRLGWYSATLLKGKDGELYYNMPINACAGETTWVQIKNSYVLDSDGKASIAFGRLFNSAGRPTIGVEKVAHLTNEYVMERAQVRPITYYFSNVTEMEAEGLSAYRGGSQARENLIRQSPQLYDVVKEHDDKEIANHYGIDGGGKSKKIRLPGGRIVDRDPTTERLVADFEARSKLAQ